MASTEESLVYANFAAAVLKVIGEALEQHSHLGAPENIFPYHSVPPADCCDFLAISLDRMFPYRIGEFPQRLERVYACSEVGLGVEFHIHLLRPCWPMLKGGHPTSPFPAIEPAAELAVHLMEDIRVMTCALIEHFEWLEECQGPCNQIQIQDVHPYPPMGGCAGWRFEFRAEFDPCCLGEVVF